MASPIKLLYGSATAITCTLSGLTDGNARQSTFIDNTSNLFVDFIVQLKVVFPNSIPTGGVDMYVAPCADGTHFDAGATGTDGTYDYSNLGGNLLTVLNGGSLFPVQNGTKYQSGAVTYSLGFAPPKFSLIVLNNSGFTLAAGSSIQYVGIKAQVG